MRVDFRKVLWQNKIKKNAKNQQMMDCRRTMGKGKEGFMENRPLTTGEIAEYCHVTYRTVLKWVEDGKLKAYRTPGHHSRVEVKNFIEFLRTYNMPVPLNFQSLLTAGKKILIVDDDKNMANSIKRVLRGAGAFEIDVAYNGFDAGRKFIGFEPDVVILDIRMPGMDGFAVTKSIRETYQGDRAKIVAISAFFTDEDKKKVLALGADECLDKPFDSATLIRTIKSLLNLPN
ncbi:MAG: response regulator [Candidatus Omnitrophica bacterium]|nr:response regulator [Candidatus Omnitrophota bacterium]